MRQVVRRLLAVGVAAVVGGTWGLPRSSHAQAQPPAGLNAPAAPNAPPAPAQVPPARLAPNAAPAPNAPPPPAAARVEPEAVETDENGKDRMIMMDFQDVDL